MIQPFTEVLPFGGLWTRQKLDCLAEYLKAYTRIFDRNPKARYFTTYYVDAFAGTGYVKTRKKRKQLLHLFDPEVSVQTEDYLEGSAVRALQTEPRFKRFLFVEKDAERCKELEQLRTQFPDKANDIEIVNGEANEFLPSWFQTPGWRNNKNRAVLFLDPFAMQVKWNLIQQIADTKAIDLWLLFPYMAFNRLLTTKKRPRPSWAKRLTDICGTDAWRTEFYKTRVEETFFGTDETTQKEASVEKIGAFVLNRLREAKFAKVAANPLILRHSRGPLFLLCFAAGNEKGAPIAVRIADSIIGSNRGR